MGDGDGAADEIWRPGYDGPDPIAPPIRPFPAPTTDPTRPTDRAGVAGPTSPAGPTSSAGPTSPAGPVVRVGAGATDRPPGRARSGRRRLERSVGGAAVVVVVAVVAIVVTIGGDDERGSAVPEAAPIEVDERAGLPGPEGDGSVGADPRRLPTRLDLRWTRALDAPRSADAWIEVAGDAVVVARGSTGGGATLEALDSATGRPRWSVGLEARLAAVDHVATGSSALVLLVDGELVGVDLATGGRAWSLVPDVGTRAVDVEHLVGTAFLAVPSGPSSVLVAADTGLVVGWIDGERVGTDGAGTWYVRRGSEVVAYDLADGWSEPVAVAEGVGAPVVAVVDGDVVASGLGAWSSTIGVDEVPARLRRFPVGGVERLPPAAGIVPLVGPSFAVEARREVFGVVADEDGLEIGWEREGVITDSFPTVRGRLVLVASRGGATQAIVDGRTGATVTVLTLVPGVFDSLIVAGDGIVTRATARGGTRLAALDLDGRELWSVKGVRDLAVGVGEVVTVARTEDGLTVARFTDP